MLWPSLNPSGYNVLLDAGADIRADADDLLKYAVMGASYARNALGLTRPRVGLLNVGTEEHKGRSELHEAAERIAAIAPASDFEYIGYVEGSDMPSDRVDVIVTDGFTGNVALKTGEGTARMIQGLLREAFAYSLLSRIGALFALTSLKRLQKRIDPRRVNGGVFLGLNGTVIKSHGSRRRHRRLGGDQARLHPRRPRLHRSGSPPGSRSARRSRTRDVARGGLPS